MNNYQSDVKSRKLFYFANEYQKQLIILALLPTIVLFLFFVIFIFLGNQMINNAIYQQSTELVGKMVFNYSLIVVLSLFMMLFIFLFLIFIISNKLFGSFGRILSELDEIIEGRSVNEMITSRPEDQLATELLKRVNVLIRSYVQKKP